MEHGSSKGIARIRVRFLEEYSIQMGLTPTPWTAAWSSMGTAVRQSRGRIGKRFGSFQVLAEPGQVSLEVVDMEVGVVHPI